MHGGGILDKGRLWEADLPCLVMIADLLAADDDGRTAGADFSGRGGKGWKAAKYLGSLPVSRTPPPPNISVGSFQFMATYKIHLSVRDEGISVSFDKELKIWLVLGRNNTFLGLRNYQFMEGSAIHCC